MIEAAMLWNEPNNLSHWDFEIDPDWSIYAAMVKCAASAIQAERPAIRRVLGGISPIDPAFIVRMNDLGVLDQLDVVAVHGFPLDWNHWAIDQWPEKLDEIRAVTCEADLGFGSGRVLIWRRRSSGVWPQADGGIIAAQAGSRLLVQPVRFAPGVARHNASQGE